MEPFLTFDVAGLLAQFGANPFIAMWLLFIYGGWVFFLIAFLWAFAEGWKHILQNKAGAKKEWIVLAIDIPKLSEKDMGQSLKAVENIFAHLAGAHSPISWTEKWFQGKYQDPISFEIISIEGHVQFVIQCLRSLRDLVEASIFAQYPDAEIAEVEDYTKNVPSSYPDDEWELWGTEMIPAGGKNSIYPLKTYPSFEHSMSSELKDPMSVLLEGLSRLDTGEQCWVQLLVLPIDMPEYQKKGEILIKKLKGENVTKPPSMLEKILFAPFNLFILLANELMGSGSSTTDKKADDVAKMKIFNMSPGERKILEAVENKVSKIGFSCKIRFMYIAKKNVFKKPRIVQSLIGFIKQMNTNDMLSLKPEAKQVGINPGLWLFQNKRNNTRRNRILSYYKNRAIWDGMPPYYLCTEELATIWHFPHTFQVKAPQVKKRELKSAEPPINLPIG
ncbi:hypothetical protein KKG46_04960 [Patescibacteria group bacterium]|nr:hypothetical protein [Patescibacteria group bacterium]